MNIECDAFDSICHIMCCDIRATHRVECVLTLYWV